MSMWPPKTLNDYRAHAQLIVREQLVQSFCRHVYWRQLAHQAAVTKMRAGKHDEAITEQKRAWREHECACAIREVIVAMDGADEPSAGPEDDVRDPVSRLIERGEDSLSVHGYGDSVVLVLRHAPLSVRLVLARFAQALVDNGG